MTATLKGAQPSVAGLVFTVKKLVEETQIELPGGKGTPFLFTFVINNRLPRKVVPYSDI